MAGIEKVSNFNVININECLPVINTRNKIFTVNSGIAIHVLIKSIKTQDFQHMAYFV